MHRWKLLEPTYRLATPGQPRRFVILELPVDGPDDLADWRWQGDADLADYIERWLLMASGFRGHIMDKHTTPLDLASAMRDPGMADFEPQHLEGKLE